MRTAFSLAILAATLGSIVLLAQDAKLQFEVASVRPSGPVPPGTPQFPGGRITGGPGTNDPENIRYERVPFQQLIMAAYGVQRDQINGPAWATSEDFSEAARFDISAKVPSGTTKDQVATMLQNLLAERFRMSLHHETVQVSGYAVVVAKGGSKLKESRGPVDESERIIPGPGGQLNRETEKDGFRRLFPGANMGGIFKDGVVRDRFRDYPLSDLSQQLSSTLAAHVIDRTGLGGKYDFTLEFTPPENGFAVAIAATFPIYPGQTAPLNKNGPTPGQQDAVPIISSAMEKQLGLKLEATKIAVDTLVIDHVEKMPTEN
jgi:uncharacterized protein (TIGR03435 family)